MKIILSAIALTVAVPAFAQNAPAPAPEAEEQKHDCKECCEKMKDKGGKMECMEKKDEAKSGGPGQQADHAGHNHAH